MLVKLYSGDIVVKIKSWTLTVAVPANHRRGLNHYLSVTNVDAMKCKAVAVGECIFEAFPPALGLAYPNHHCIDIEPTHEAINNAKRFIFVARSIHR